MSTSLFTYGETGFACKAADFPLANPGPELFNETAQRLAQDLSDPQMGPEKGKRGEPKYSREANRPAQIRKFYDELRLWEQRAAVDGQFEELLPFIKMMNAKVAYARGRKFVDDKFLAWFSCCMNQIRNDDSGLTALRNFCTLFEAFLGFYKLERSDD